MLIRGNVISEGGFGTAYHCIYNDKESVIKVSEPDNMVFILNEIKILKDIDNENIIKCLGYEDLYPEIFIILEFGGEDLYSLLHNGELHANEKSDVTIQILKGVKFLHENNICHRDIKMENILYNFNTVKIIDFGFAYRYEVNEPHKNLTKKCGCRYYIAPEVYSYNIPYDGFAADIWSLGVCLFCLYSNLFLFEKPHISDPHYKAFEMSGSKISNYLTYYPGLKVEDSILYIIENSVTKIKYRKNINEFFNYYNNFLQS